MLNSCAADVSGDELVVSVEAVEVGGGATVRRVRSERPSIAAGLWEARRVASASEALVKACRLATAASRVRTEPARVSGALVREALPSATVTGKPARV